MWFLADTVKTTSPRVGGLCAVGVGLLDPEPRVALTGRTR